MLLQILEQNLSQYSGNNNSNWLLVHFIRSAWKKARFFIPILQMGKLMHWKGKKPTMESR